MKLFAVFFTILSVSALAQNPVEGMPSAKGVYYKTGAGWSTLQWSLLYPQIRNQVAEFLSVGPRRYVAEVPGEHAMMMVSEAQPTFFVRGLSNAIGPRLVQFTSKRDLRQVNMKKASIFAPEVPISEKDLREIEIAVLSENVIAVRPKGNLPAGEYALVTNGLEDARRIMLSFEFRVAGR